MKKKNNKGFSLIELIIAIAILVILTGLLAPQFMKYIEKSREAKDMQTLDSVYSAVQGALADEEAYKVFVDEYTADKAQIRTGVSMAEVLKDSNAFTEELVTLLGENKEGKWDLQSKKANGGEVCIKIDFVTDPDDATDTVMTGLSIGVYCGDTNGNVEGTLAQVGTGSDKKKTNTP